MDWRKLRPAVLMWGLQRAGRTRLVRMGIFGDDLQLVARESVGLKSQRAERVGRGIDPGQAWRPGCCPQGSCRRFALGRSSGSGVSYVEQTWSTRCAVSSTFGRTPRIA